MPLTASACKARNSVAPNTSPSSTSSRPNRTSGLSEPNRDIASCHVIVAGAAARVPVTASAASSTASPITRHHVVGIGEAHLGVELHELELAIGAQVLVAQTARDLVVAIEAADHQQLLEQLRALRERVERAGRQA